MKLKEALKRIEELERKVAELQAQPKQDFHYPYYWQQPIYQQPAYLPQFPHYPSVWMGAWGQGTAIGSNLSYGPDH